MITRACISAGSFVRSTSPILSNLAQMFSICGAVGLQRVYGLHCLGKCKVSSNSIDEIEFSSLIFSFLVDKLFKQYCQHAASTLPTAAAAGYAYSVRMRVFSHHQFVILTHPASQFHFPPLAAVATRFTSVLCIIDSQQEHRNHALCVVHTFRRQSEQNPHKIRCLTKMYRWRSHLPSKVTGLVGL